MANEFSITTATTHVDLDARRRGELAVTVTNATGRSLQGRAQLEASGGASSTWLSLEGEPTRSFAVAESAQFTVRIAVPPEAPPGDYTVRLNMVGVANPDEEFSEGPSVTLTVPAVEAVPAPKRPFPWLYVLIALGLVAVAIILLVLWSRRGPETVAVPGDVAGMTVADATARLEALGLTASSTERTSLDVAAGRVITTDPISGTAVEKGAAVQLIVSSGLPMVTVPDGLVGQAGAEAEAALQALGLVVDSSQAPSSEVAQGLVISAQPAPGTNVAISSTVALVISSGPEMVTVPEVVNQSEADATSALQEAGFAVTATQQHSSSVAQGNVISASPAPGTSVEKGSTVEIVVSAGPEMVTVPNVVNQTQAQAAAALQQAGLAATASQQSSTSVAQGNVISSSPAAGARVEKGSTVQIVVSSGPEMVTVPNVINKPFDQAQSELQGLGFAVVQSGSDWNVSIPKGAVISSNPGAGQSVVKGSTVQLRVSAGRQPGQITVHNQGAYVARFRVEYTMNGQKVDRSPDFTAGTNQTLGLPSEAENIRVVVEEAVFINTWTTIFAQSFQFPVTKCYVIGGTTLSPNWREC